MKEFYMFMFINCFTQEPENMRESTLVIVAKTEPSPSVTGKVTATLNCTREHNSSRNISADTQPCAETHMQDPWAQFGPAMLKSD